MMTKTDMLLITFIVLAASSIFIFQINTYSPAAFLTINKYGTEVYRLPLPDNRVIGINDAGNLWLIRVSDFNIRVVYSDCPNKTCMVQGTISRPDMPVLCIPLGIKAELHGSPDMSGIDAVTK